jgi:chorismate mutase
MSDKIFKYRKKIDEIDNKILNLLSKRLYNVQKIGELKQQLGIPLGDNAREKEILERLYHMTGDSLSSSQIDLIFNTIFEVAKEIQQGE